MVGDGPLSAIEIDLQLVLLMNRPVLTLLLCASLTLAASRPAPTAPQEQLSPDSLAAEFQTAMRAMAWRAAAHRMHGDGLARFQELIDMLVDTDAEATLGVLFDGMDEAAYRSLSPDGVFIEVMRYMATEMRGLLHALVVRDIEIIGAVPEPPDLAHVVYRSAAQLSGAVPQIRVMTLKREAKDWRVLDTQELDVIREALRGTPRRAREGGSVDRRQ